VAKTSNNIFYFSPKLIQKFTVTPKVTVIFMFVGLVASSSCYLHCVTPSVRMN